MIDAELRAEWYADVYSRMVWEPEDPPLVRYTAERVHCAGLIAWRKPAAPRLDRTEAAREKIAADLAREMGAPVAPVLLLEPRQWPGRDPACVSLQCHELHGVVPTHERAPTLRVMAARPHMRPDHVPWSAVAFEVFVNALDRHGNWHVGRDRRGGPAELVMFDHSTALHALDGPLCRLPPEALEPLRRLSDAAICGLVERVPQPFLDRADARRMARQLVRRRARLLAGETEPLNGEWRVELGVLADQLKRLDPKRHARRAGRVRRI